MSNFSGVLLFSWFISVIFMIVGIWDVGYYLLKFGEVSDKVIFFLSSSLGAQVFLGTLSSYMMKRELIMGSKGHFLMFPALLISALVIIDSVYFLYGPTKEGWEFGLYLKMIVIMVVSCYTIPDAIIALKKEQSDEQSA